MNISDHPPLRPIPEGEPDPPGLTDEQIEEALEQGRRERQKLAQTMRRVRVLPR